MTPELEMLLQHLARLAERLSPETIDYATGSLMSAEGDGLRGRLATIGSTAAARTMLQELDDLWQRVPDCGARSLGMAMQAARIGFERSSRQQQVSIVWTGPATEAVPMRRTEQVLIEIIENAKSELLIVTFVTYKVDRIIAALARAIERGVALKMVLETEADSGGKVTFDQASIIAERLPRARLYVWPLEKRHKDAHGHHGSIHVKCAVADRKTAMVSSANLTGLALELNMELGLKIRGDRVPQSIAAHFEELIRRNVLVASSGGL